MLSHKFRTHIQGLLTALILGIFCPTTASSQTAQIVQKIYGTGFVPTSLKEGQRLPSGTLEVEADSETILILKREWQIELGKCVEMVVIKNSYYRILTDSDCPRAFADVTAVQRAMDGDSVNEIIRMPFYDDRKITGNASGDSDNFSDLARSDDGPDPSLMLKRLNNDIGKLCENSSIGTCNKHSAKCMVVHTLSGAATDACHWPTKNTAAACKSAKGIWTTPGSKYARNHPNVVPPGSSGICASEVNNLK